MLQEKLCKYLFESLFSVGLSLSVVELLDWVIIACLDVWGSTKLLPTVIAPLYFPIDDVEEFQFLHILPVLIICPIHSHSSRGDMVSHCDLIYALLLANDVGHIFICCISYLYISVEECLFESLPPFFIELFIFLSVRAISIFWMLDSYIWFVNVFSFCVDYLFVFLILSFDTVRSILLLLLCFWSQV